MLTTLMGDGRIPTMPIYLDSPMAINVSNIYYRHTELHRLNREQCYAMYSTINFVNHVEESKALADISFPHIIIAGSGMATGGRILHHLKTRIEDRRTTVLFTGYQAGGTRGAKMLQGVETVKIHGQWLRNRARIEVLSGLSGHGDYKDIGRWLAQSSLPPKTSIQLVHGDPDALEGMRDHLRQTTKFDGNIAGYRKILTL